MEQCNKDIYDNGTIVFMTNTIRSVDMEAWTQAIAKESGQPVDWSMYAGRAVMQALGDLHKVRKSIINLRKMHDEGYTKAVLALGCFDKEFAEERVKGIWDYNYKEHDLWSYTCSKCRGRCLPQNHAGWDPTQEGHG
jgi:hypothetical protein